MPSKLGATRQVNSKVIKSILSDKFESVESEFRCYSILMSEEQFLRYKGKCPQNMGYSDVLFSNFPM